MLRCQALRAAPCVGLRGAAAARQQRLRPARPACAAAPEGGLPGGPGGAGKPKPSSSRRAAGRGGAGSTGQGEQERLEGAMLPPFAMREPEGDAPAGAAGAGSAALPHSAAPTSASAEDGSWDSWQQYFYEMDDVVQEMDALHSELDEAVAAEDYRAAAALKAQLDRLEAADCVGAALDELRAAVEEERFADAAALRDESGASLLGWWVGRGEDDSVGHLLRITRDFGRLVGTVYSARDITDLALEPQQQLPGAGDARLSALAAAMTARSGGGSMIQEAGPVRPDDVGLPVLEVFLRRAPEGCPSGRRYEQQAAALYAPEEAVAEAAADMEQDAVTSAISEFIAADPTRSVVSIEQGQNEDGSAFMKIEISSVQDDDDDNGTRDEEEMDVQQAAADYDREEDDGIRTIDDLAASVGMRDVQGMAGEDDSDSSGVPGDARGEVGEEEEEQLLRWQQQAAGGGGPGIPEDMDALTAALLGAAEAAQSQQWSQADEEEEEGGEAVEVPSTAAKLGAILQRTPAHITWSGRDSFTVTVSEPPALVQQRRQYEVTAAAAAAAAAVPALQRPPVRIIYDGKEQLRQQQEQQEQQEQQQEQQQQGAQGEQQREQQSEARPQQPGDAQGPSAAASSQGGANADGSRDVEVTAEESDSEEVSVLLSPAQQARREQRAQQEQQAEESAALAESLERVREQLEAGAKVDSEVINDIARRAMGLAIAQGITSADAAGAALAERWAAMEGHTEYQRLPLDFCRTDPFDGLYVGTFGPHGPELLRVSRQVEGGQEWAVATKLTGDPNVPAGAVSWKALIGRANRLPAEMYPAEMAVTGRYRGQGQVAQAGFNNPKWVDGELLVFGADSAFVQGAQLGFTYDVSRSQRYLIVLHRIDLDEIFPEEEE